MLPRAEGKRYSRTHLAYLTAICVLKQVLSVKETGLLSLPRPSKATPRSPVRRRSSGGARPGAGRDGKAACDGRPRGGAARLALDLALRSYADRLACERILELLESGGPGPERDAKITGK